METVASAQGEAAVTGSQVMAVSGGPENPPGEPLHA